MTPTDQAKLLRILEAAARGVSADNGQPWLFRWRRSRLVVLLDQARSRSFFDQGRFAAYLGLGSVLENLSIAAVVQGYAAQVRHFPQGEPEGPLAVAGVTLHPAEPRPHALYPALWNRTTNRHPYYEQPVRPKAKAALLEAASAWPSFRLLLVEQAGQRAALARLTREAELIRFDFSRREIHEDFFQHLRYSRTEGEAAGDGLWVKCLEADPGAALVLRLLAAWRLAASLSRVGLNRLFAAPSARLLRSTPLIGLVIANPASPAAGKQPSTREPTGAPSPSMFLDGGRLCHRLWLTATAQELAVQPMAVLPLFFAQLACHGQEGFPAQAGPRVVLLRRDCFRIFGLTDREHPIMLFRLGYAPAPSARSFRRTVGDLLTIEDDSPLA